MITVFEMLNDWEETVYLELLFVLQNAFSDYKIIALILKIWTKNTA